VSVSVSSVWGVSSSPNLANPNMRMQSDSNAGNTVVGGAVVTGASGVAGGGGPGSPTTGGGNMTHGSQFDQSGGPMKQINNQQQGLMHLTWVTLI